MTQKPLPVAKTSPASSWVAALSVLFYLALLSALVLLPGSSLLDRLRWLDSGICAQMPTHSFYPGGEELPLCARNTGIYLGFIVTLLTLYATGRGRAQGFPPWPIVVVLASGVGLLAFDGFNSFFLDLGLPHLYQPHNLIRLATGLMTGLALATLSLPALNRLLWHKYDEQPSVSSWLMLLAYTPALILCFFAVLSQSIVVLYPIALLSTAGILTTLSSLNLIVIVAISKRDESFERYRDVLPFFSLALLFAIGEMLALAQLKFLVLRVFGI
jgi:uncharacterized membrane protein